MKMNRVEYYDICHEPQKAWNTFSDEIKHLENDLFIINANKIKIGEIPADIQKTLFSLKLSIEKALK